MHLPNKLVSLEVFSLVKQEKYSLKTLLLKLKSHLCVACGGLFSSVEWVYCCALWTLAGNPVGVSRPLATRGALKSPLGESQR